jgi:membrane-bound ClpP family serine protease
MFKTNVGGIDRVLRIVIGLGLVVLAAMGTIGVWGYIGVVLLLSGLMRTCPAYSLLGMNTCPTKAAPK